MLARAKLNLSLHVTGQRADGYHLLSSLVAFADVGDEVRIEPGQKDTLTVDGPFANAAPPLAGNILGQALAMVRRWNLDALAREPLSIHLTKNLPVASGIGGGSADAAALVALLTAGRPLSDSEMADCLSLGADLPMCLTGRSAIVGGIGEENRPVALPETHVVLVNPGAEVSTPAVFKALPDKTNAPLPPWVEPRDFAELVTCLKTTRNDLMKPAVRLVPDIQNCLKALADAPFARMSGSGATCFALLETESGAENLAGRIQSAHPNWWVQAGRLST